MSPGAMRRAGLNMQFQIAVNEYGTMHTVLRAADQGADPRKKLLRFKRFAKVVVRAAVKPVDTVFTARQRRQHQDRRGYACLEAL